MKRIQRFSSGPGLADGRICFRVTSVCPGFTLAVTLLRDSEVARILNRRRGGQTEVTLKRMGLPEMLS